MPLISHLLGEPKTTIDFSGFRKALKCLPSTSIDIAERELARSYASFALPKTSEGFDQVVPWIYLVGNRPFEKYP